MPGAQVALSCASWARSTLGSCPSSSLLSIGVAIKPEAVGQQVADGGPIFVAGGQLEVRRIVGDRRVEVDLALLGELGDHRRRDALRHRRPAEHRFRSHRLARALRASRHSPGGR